MVGAGRSEEPGTRPFARVFAGIWIDDDHRKVLTAGVCNEVIPALCRFSKISGLHCVWVFVSGECPLTAGSAAVDRKRDGITIDAPVSRGLETAMHSASKSAGPEHDVLRHAERPCGARTRK